MVILNARAEFSEQKSDKGVKFPAILAGNVVGISEARAYHVFSVFCSHSPFSI
jgi:hypothetical protein